MLLVVYLQTAGEPGDLLDFLAGFTPVVEPGDHNDVFLEMPRDGVRSLLRRIQDAGCTPAAAGIGTNPLVARAAVLAGCRGLGRRAGLVRMRFPDGGTPVFVVRPGAEAAFMAGLPVEMLWPLPEKIHRRVLRELGLVTCGDVVAVGERELRAYCGASAALVVAYSRGVDSRRVRPLYPPPECSWRCVLGGAVERRVLEAALATGARELAGRLRRQTQGYRHLRLELEPDGGGCLAAERQFPAHISPDPERLVRQLRLLLDTLTVTGPVDVVRVTAGMLYRLESEQVELFSAKSRAADGLARAVAALGDRYPGRLVRGGDLRPAAARREQMLALYDPWRGAPAAAAAAPGTTGPRQTAAAAPLLPAATSGPAPAATVPAGWGNDAPDY